MDKQQDIERDLKLWSQLLIAILIEFECGENEAMLEQIHPKNEGVEWG